MNHLPTDSLHHLLGFADAYDLCAAASVCHEWLQLVANPSMARSELWATLAAGAWHRAHRTHASLMHVRPVDELDSGSAAASVSSSLPAASEAEEEAQGDLALARLHSPAHPPAAVVAPGLPDSVGYRELFFYSTLWPHAIDCSSPAVFSTTAGDPHQMAIRPLLPMESMLASDRIAAQKEAKAMTQMLKRMGVFTSETDATGAAAAAGITADLDDADEDEGMNDHGGDDDEDDDGDDSDEFFDEEEEVSRMASLPEEEWCAGVKERFLEEILERVEQERVELAQARRLAARNRRNNAGAPPARAGARVEARVADATAATGAGAAATPADAAPNRPGVRRRAIPNGPTPASADGDTPIADAESSGEADAADPEAEDETDEIDADALDEEDAEDDDEDGEDEEDAEDEEGEEDDEEDGDDFDSDSPDELIDADGKPLSAEDAAERKDMEDAIRDEADADMRVSALFTLAIEEAAPLVKLTARRKVVDDLLCSEEGMSLIKLLRTNELRRISIDARRTARRNAQTLANSAFDLGILASPSEASESLPANEEHLTRFAYVGLSNGSDRSVRSNVPFPTRMPNHAVPFTVVSWVSRQAYETMLREEAAERAQQALPGFSKASEAAAAAAGANADDDMQEGPKRKHPAAPAESSSSSSSKEQKDASIYSGLPDLKKQRIQSMATVFASVFATQVSTKTTGASSVASAGGLDDDDHPHDDFSASVSSASSCAYVPLVRLSLIAYYEITIEKAAEIKGTGPAAAARRRAARAAESEHCVALGFCTSRFRLASKQPGWDRSSWGLHGDDGSLFHGSGDSVATLDPRGFGPGDVVGAGVDYRSGEIFFTRNGVYLGVGFKLPRTESLTLYAAVGIDAPHAIHINFGADRPFLFDIVAHERAKGYLSNMGRAAAAPASTTATAPAAGPTTATGDAPVVAAAGSSAATAASAESKEMEDSAPSAPAAASASSSASASPAALSPAAQLLSDYRSFLRAKREWRGKLPAAAGAGSTADASKPKM